MIKRKTTETVEEYKDDVLVKRTITETEETNDETYKPPSNWGNPNSEQLWPWPTYLSPFRYGPEDNCIDATKAD